MNVQTAPPRSMPLRLLVLSALLAAAPLSSAQSAPAPAQPAPATPEAAPTPTTPTPTTPAPTPPAQTTPPATVANPLLNFAQVRSALRNTPGWRSAEEAFRAAQLSVQSARARAGLNLTVGGDVSVDKKPVDSGDWKASATATASLSAAVLPWGSAFDPVRSAERALTRAGTTLQDARLSLTVTALQSYLATRTAAAQQLLSTAQADLAARQLAVAQDQRAGELLSAEGLLAAEGALESAQASAADAASNRSLSERQLLSDLGLDLGPVPPVLSSAPSLPGTLPVLESFLSRALASRSEILNAASALIDARAGLAAATRERLPDVSASASYGEVGTVGSGRTVGGSLNFKTGVGGLNLNYPILRDDTTSTGAAKTPATGFSLGLSGNFNILGGAQNAAIDSAGSGVRSAELALESTRTSIELDVRKNYNAAQSTRRLAGVQRIALTRAQTALSSTQARLEAGLSTALDLQSAQIAVQSAQLGLDSAAANAYLAQIQLDKASAGLDPALILTAGAQP